MLGEKQVAVPVTTAAADVRPDAEASSVVAFALSVGPSVVGENTTSTVQLAAPASVLPTHWFCPGRTTTPEIRCM